MSKKGFFKELGDCITRKITRMAVPTPPKPPRAPRPPRGGARVVIRGQTIVSDGNIVIVNGRVIQGADDVAGAASVSGSGVPGLSRRVLPPFDRLENSIMGSVEILVDPRIRFVEAPPPSESDEGPHPYREPAPDPQEEMESSYVVEITGDDNILSFVQTEVDDNTLKISMKSGAYSYTTPLVVHVKALSLVYLKHSGHGYLTATNVTGERLELRHSGMGDFSVEGTAQEIEAQFSGHGDVDIRGLLDTNVLELRHSGMGDLHMAGTARTIHARLSGHGDVDLSALRAEHIHLMASGMGDLHIDAKAVSGRHSAHGDLTVKGSKASVEWDVKSTGMGDINFGPG